ncbi:hypothetical protein CCP2SC5_810006 [Azospirillaceae bacterium]
MTWSASWFTFGLGMHMPIMPTHGGYVMRSSATWCFTPETEVFCPARRPD